MNENKPRGPDYVSVQGSFYVWSGGIAFDLSTGDAYYQIGTGRAYPAYSIKPGASVMFGNINEWSGSADTADFLKGAGNSGNVIVPLANPWFGVGGGWNHSYGGKTSIEYGFGSPGVSVSPAGYGWERKK